MCVQTQHFSEEAFHLFRSTLLILERTLLICSEAAPQTPSGKMFCQHHFFLCCNSFPDTQVACVSPNWDDLKYEDGQWGVLTTLAHPVAPVVQKMISYSSTLAMVAPQLSFVAMNASSSPTVSSCTSILASLPGNSHQYLITCSMQIRRGNLVTNNDIK